jgi:hypothetical protein
MGALNADQILQAQDLQTRDVECPEWGGIVRVRALTGAERDDYEQATVEIAQASQGKRLPNMRARLCVMCMVNDAGERLFSIAQVEALGAKSAAVLDRIYDVAAELSGLTRASREAAEKNLPPGPSAGPTSDSPAS